MKNDLRIIATSDWHLTEDTDKEYRWEVFQNLMDSIVDLEPDAVIFAGDLTDKKAGHSEVMVNRMVESFNGLSNLLVEREVVFYFITGNHDYLMDPSNPFFKFLEVLPNINVVVDTKVVEFDNEEIAFPVMMIPHRHTPMHRRVDIDEEDVRDATLIFMHETFHNAKASNGMKMEGSRISTFTNTQASCFSGDIHVPQKLGPITYIGTPHPVHFGDVYESRMLLIDVTEDKVHVTTLRMPHTLKRAHIQVRLGHVRDDFTKVVKDNNLHPEDHVKVTIRGSSRDIDEWRTGHAEVTTLLQKYFFESYGVVEKLTVRVPLMLEGECEDVVREVMLTMASSADSLMRFSKAVGLLDEQVSMGKRIIENNEDLE